MCQVMGANLSANNEGVAEKNVGTRVIVISGHEYLVFG